MLPTLFVFLRHAESVANAGGWLSGWEDVALTTRGQEQARVARTALAEWPVARCLVSDLTRARHTAALAMPHPLPTHVLADLRERHMGELQGASIAEVRADGRMDRYLLPWDARAPGGETHAESTARALACLRLWADGTPTLVVAHGSLIRDVVGLLDGTPTADLGRMRAAGHALPIVRHVERWPDGGPA